MPEFSSIRDAINALAELLRKVHRPYAGAQFRLALIRDGGLRFLTGSVLFRPEQVPSRAPADYGYLRFVEEWCPEQDAALGLLSKLLSGQTEIGGHKVTNTFNRSRLHHEMYAADAHELWSGWTLTSMLDRDANFREVYLHQDPLLSFDQKPYVGASGAIHEWVFNEPAPQPRNNTPPHAHEIVTFLPDTRARIISALWLPGKLSLNLEVNVPASSLQLQLVQAGSSHPYQLLLASEGSREIDVPDDTRELSIYVVDNSGECVTQNNLRALYEGSGKYERQPGVDARAAADLASGEGERIEYKPFLIPHNEKENEFLETVIAFGNTAGGRVYVGVRDRNGEPEGTRALVKAFKQHTDTGLLDIVQEALNAQTDRVRWLQRVS
jgi:hypothetical protein